ncbi:MAG: pyridine nucleotide-disulfide oxidoreductase, partial [Desulfuromonadales bacterium]|nr:pyridine nucleotide-disulfide oxidoreductase [Desulfuromonadales bacterium]
MGKNKSWLCTVCGYVHEGGEAPECCPVCGATRDLFEAFVTDQEAVTPEKTTSWRCLNCDYVAEGDAPPELCPVCGAAADKFEALVVAEDKTSSSKVTHHVVIIGAGVSGVSAAEAARKTSPGSKITLISREAHLP